MAGVPPPPPPDDAARASVAGWSRYLTRVAGVRVPEGEIRACWPVLPDGSVGDAVGRAGAGLAILRSLDPVPARQPARAPARDPCVPRSPDANHHVYISHEREVIEAMRAAFTSPWAGVTNRPDG